MSIDSKHERLLVRGDAVWVRVRDGDSPDPEAFIDLNATFLSFVGKGKEECRVLLHDGTERILTLPRNLIS